MPSRMTIAAVAAVLLACVSGAWAEVVMETVPVGNPGNADDTYGDGYGGVDYEYNIGTYEVTAGQYREFLNAVATSDPNGLYNSTMDSDVYGCQITQNGTDGSYTYDFSGGTVESPGSTEADWADRPVNWVDWYDTLRFANWMHNGQPTGAQDHLTTENGAYDMSLGSSVVRKPGALVFLPTEDEWCKAAYHKNDGVTGNYFDYPTSSDSFPSNDLIDPDPGNNATFWDSGGVGDYTIGSPYWRTEFGVHENSDSPYGTFDQGGNLREWNETLIGSDRGLRGGDFGGIPLDMDAGYYWGSYTPSDEYHHIGFRIAVPEHATIALLAVGGLLATRRRR